MSAKTYSQDEAQTLMALAWAHGYTYAADKWIDFDEFWDEHKAVPQLAKNDIVITQILSAFEAAATEDKEPKP